MKQLPDEKTLLEILELARDFEQSTREMCDIMSIYIVPIICLAP